jgi:hypothetical protein
MWELIVDRWGSTPDVPPLNRRIMLFVEDEMLVGQVVALVTDPLVKTMTIQREPHGKG